MLRCNFTSLLLAEKMWNVKSATVFATGLTSNYSSINDSFWFEKSHSQNKLHVVGFRTVNWSTYTWLSRLTNRLSQIPVGQPVNQRAVICVHILQIGYPTGCIVHTHRYWPISVQLTVIQLPTCLHLPFCLLNESDNDIRCHNACNKYDFNMREWHFQLTFDIRLFLVHYLTFGNNFVR